MKEELTPKELQEESLKILKDVHQFCVSNDITYSVAYGTLIGTIRHKGFIPWDDDIDIILPRPHYDRFCKTYKSNRYKIKSPELDKDCMLAFARVYDDKDTITDPIIPWNLDKTGIWIDVFPMDSVPDYDDFMKKGAYATAINNWRKSITSRTSIGRFRKDKPWLFNIKLAVKKILYNNGRKTRIYINKIIECQQLIPFRSTNHWSQLGCLDSVEYHRMEDFESTILMPFENTEVMVMNGYDNVLRECFGDYMQLPPIDNRIGHSSRNNRFYWKR